MHKASIKICMDIYYNNGRWALLPDFWAMLVSFLSTANFIQLFPGNLYLESIQHGMMGHVDCVQNKQGRNL